VFWRWEPKRVECKYVLKEKLCILFLTCILPTSLSVFNFYISFIRVGLRRMCAMTKRDIGLNIQHLFLFLTSIQLLFLLAYESFCIIIAFLVYLLVSFATNLVIGMTRFVISSDLWWDNIRQYYIVSFLVSTFVFVHLRLSLFMYLLFRVCTCLFCHIYRYLELSTSPFVLNVCTCLSTTLFIYLYLFWCICWSLLPHM